MTQRSNCLSLLLIPTRLFSQTIEPGGGHSLNSNLVNRILERISVELLAMSFFMLFKSPKVWNVM